MILNVFAAWSLMFALVTLRAMGIDTAHDWVLLFMLVTAIALFMPDHPVFNYIKWHYREVFKLGNT